MRRTIALLAAGLVGASAIAAAPASEQQRPADVGFNMELALGDSDTVGGENAGLGPWNIAGDDYICEGTPHEMCEVVLVKVDNTYEEANAKKGRERANLDLCVSSSIPAAINDFAIRVFESDESGAPGELVGTADNSAGEIASGACNEEMTVVVTSTEDESSFYYRVEVIFWAAAGDWTLDAGFTQ